MPTGLPVDRPEQARRALRAAADGERRVLDALVYGRVAPFFVVWGTVWAFGFVGTGLGLAQEGAAWAAAVAAGWAGTVLLVRARAARAEPGTSTASRYALSAALLSAHAVIWALLLLRHPPNALGAYAGTVTGCAYAIAGLWRGRLLALLGLAITALFLAGLPLPPAAFALCAGILGGGGLVAAGLLLSRMDPS